MRTRPLLLCFALLASTSCLAAGPFDFYGGAGVGQGTVVQNDFQINGHATGWKVFGGWRPFESFGAEVEYADFGSKDANYNNGVITTHATADAHATALFGVGYLPAPLPFIDLYAKAGVARVQSNASASFGCAAGGSSCGPPAPVTDDSNRTSFAWGAGIQARLGIPAVRLDYERFSASQGNDSLIAVSVTANF